MSKDEKAVDTILDIIYNELDQEANYWSNQHIGEETDWDYIYGLLNAYEFMVRKHTTYLKRYANYETLNELISEWGKRKEFDGSH